MSSLCNKTILRYLPVVFLESEDSKFFVNERSESGGMLDRDIGPMYAKKN
jgi:hypothetical protein